MTDRIDAVMIRDAASGDIGDIAELEKITFPLPWSAESIRHDIEENENATVLVAERSGDFAGYADIWCVAGEGMLNNIAVMPDHRGKHVGLAIMEALIGRLGDEGVTEMSLEVRRSNTPAIGLYTKLGFKEAGVRTGYYADNGEDALILKRGI
jgi:ribosomal-protein-alanine N-acetyltransferase